MRYKSVPQPRVVQTYITQRDLNECMGILDDLLVTLRDDFAKYKNSSPVMRLAEVHESVFFQTGRKFMYSKIDSASSAKPLKASLDLLVRAGLAIKVHHSSSRGLPLAAQAKSSKFKVLPSDIGLCQRALGLDLPTFLTMDDVELVNRGSIAEVFVGLELVSNDSPRTRSMLHYWHREARSSQAEVDYVIQRDSQVVPIEVKSGSTGKMRSMHLFLKERDLPTGIRVSTENFSRYDKIETVPMYAVWTLFH